MILWDVCLLKGSNSMYTKYIILFIITAFIFSIHFNRLSAEQDYESYKIENNKIVKPLIDGVPNSIKGREIVISRAGNCLACHNIGSLKEPFQGNIGPSLDGIGNKYSEGELRLRLVNPYYLNPNSLMPAFFRKDGLMRVARKYSEKTILTAEQIEDVISWLLTLK